MAIASIQGRTARATATTSGKLTALIPLATGRASCRAILAARVDATDDRLRAPALALLPPGRAFVADEGSVLRSVCDALSRTFSRLFRLADDARQSLIPGTPGSLAAVWARTLALQDGESADQRLAEGPFTLAEFERRLLEVWRGAGIEVRALIFEVAPRAPFCVSISRVGDPLRGDDWRFRLDVTVVAPRAHMNDARALGDAYERAPGRKAFEAWLARAFPPWCALCLAAKSEGKVGLFEIATVNLPRRR